MPARSSALRHHHGRRGSRLGEVAIVGTSSPSRSSRVAIVGHVITIAIVEIARSRCRDRRHVIAIASVEGRGRRHVITIAIGESRALARSRSSGFAARRRWGALHASAEEPPTPARTGQRSLPGPHHRRSYSRAARPHLLRALRPTRPMVAARSSALRHHHGRRGSRLLGVAASARHHHHHRDRRVSRLLEVAVSARHHHRDRRESRLGEVAIVGLRGATQVGRAPRVCRRTADACLYRAGVPAGPAPPPWLQPRGPPPPASRAVPDSPDGARAILRASSPSRSSRVAPWRGRGRRHVGTVTITIEIVEGRVFRRSRLPCFACCARLGRRCRATARALIHAFFSERLSEGARLPTRDRRLYQPRAAAGVSVRPIKPCCRHPIERSQLFAGRVISGLIPARRLEWPPPRAPSSRRTTRRSSTDRPARSARHRDGARRDDASC